MTDIYDALKDLSAFHEAPYSNIRGAQVRIKTVNYHVAVPNGDPRKEVESKTTTIREGTIVGRGEGRGISYDSSGANAYMDTTIGPSIYLETAEDTIVEVRTDKPENKLLDITPGSVDS